MHNTIKRAKTLMSDLQRSVGKDVLPNKEARPVVARLYGLDSWHRLEEACSGGGVAIPDDMDTRLRNELAALGVGDHDEIVETVLPDHTPGWRKATRETVHDIHPKAGRPVVITMPAGLGEAGREIATCLALATLSSWHEHVLRNDETFQVARFPDALEAIHDKAMTDGDHRQLVTTWSLLHTRSMADCGLSGWRPNPGEPVTIHVSRDVPEAIVTMVTRFVERLADQMAHPSLGSGTAYWRAMAGGGRWDWTDESFNSRIFPMLNDANREGMDGLDMEEMMLVGENASLRMMALAAVRWHKDPEGDGPSRMRRIAEARRGAAAGGHVEILHPKPVRDEGGDDEPRKSHDVAPTDNEIDPAAMIERVEGYNVHYRRLRDASRENRPAIREEMEEDCIERRFLCYLGEDSDRERAAREGHLMGWMEYSDDSHFVSAEEASSCGVQFWKLNAVFYQQDDWRRMPRREELVGRLTATVVIPFARRAASDASMADIMDSHSAMMNDLWRTLSEDVAGGGSVKKWLEKNTVEDMGMPGSVMLLHNAWIDPDRRGKGMLQRVLGIACTSLENGAYFVHPRSRAFDPALIGRNEDEAEERLIEIDQTMHPGHNTSRPAIVVVPVEGTRPAGNRVNPMLAGSTRKAARTRVDPVVERRRERFSAHLRSMNPGCPVHTYNPWDYPAC